jgi:pyruvate dehydrogenase E2 component (dihydrolipoamide acetyltransferase)
MSEAWEQIPHFWLHHSIDVTELEKMRQNFKERASEAGGALTVTVIMLKILAGALKANPKFNASLDSAANELVLKRYYNIGVAVDTDRGLVVPVLRDVDEKNIIELSVELKELSEQARNNNLAIEDMRGGTFTLTNLGGMGTGHFTAVIHHPEVAILGLGRAQQTPVLDEAGQWEPRLMMPITIGCDHRVIDGADGARFINWIAEAIDQPFLLAL